MSLRVRMCCSFTVVLSVCAICSSSLAATTYWVDNTSPGAADTNPGTEAQPWLTLGRAAKAPELRPGDTVLIRSGVYREWVDVTVSGEPGNPVTLAAAPGARVVIKGSDIIKGPWTRVADIKDTPDPFPAMHRRVWQVQLGDAYFSDPRFPGAYDDKAKRRVSQVFWEDNHPLQMIGQDPVYENETLQRMVTIGESAADMIPQSFYWDPAAQVLSVNIGGEPGWYCMEVGVRGFALTASNVHDVIIRGFEMRHNRQPGGQWPLVAIGSSQRVVVEDCKVQFADFCGMSLHQCRDCTVRRCDLSQNGAIGLALGVSEDCLIEDCSLSFNNTRHFYGDWGVAAGTKCIPGNKRITVRRCEAAYNNEAEGIWFDTDNEDIRILDNVCHDNGDCGIFFEINKAGGIIAGNLVYGNLGRGIYVSGSQNTWVVHNTVVENGAGIVAMTRAADEPPKNVQIQGNLLIGNYLAGSTVTRGCDLTLEQRDAAWCADLGSHSDYNVYADNTWVPTMRHNWNDNNTLSQWQERTGQDRNSVLRKVAYRRFSTGFELLSEEGLDVAGALPDRVLAVWQPGKPGRAGASITRWPGR